MDRWILQIFLLLALIPIAIFLTQVALVLAPLILCGLAINAYRQNNIKEQYFWIILGMIALVIAFFILNIF